MEVPFSVSSFISRVKVYERAGRSVSEKLRREIEGQSSQRQKKSVNCYPAFWNEFYIYDDKRVQRLPVQFPLEETCIQSFFPKKTTLMYPKPHDKSLRKQESFGQHRCIVFFVQIPVVSRCYLNKYAIINGVFHKFEIEDKVGRPGGGVLQEFLGGEVPLRPWNP